MGRGALPRASEGGVGLPDLRAALAAIPEAAWSQPSDLAANGAHHGYRIIRIVIAKTPQQYAAPFASVLERFAPVRDAWVSALEPGGFIVPHADGAPWFERWQVPIYTAGWFDGVELVDGRPFRVRQWEPHHLGNPTDRRRVNLVIDRDIRIDRAPEPFRLEPMVPEVQELIWASKK